jgi:hypothetical protein
MGMIKLIAAPIRSVIRFPLFQLAVVVAIILWFQAAPETSVQGRLFAALDGLVDATVSLFAAMFTVKSFTKSWLTSGFWIAYVYLACLVILAIARFLLRIVIDIVGRTNLFYLRNAIARDRGIEAYRAWLPLERIRPDNISQETWEERFAWPADNSPPYLPWPQRFARAFLVYVGVIVAIAIAIQMLTPFPVVNWSIALARRLVG